MATPKLKLTMKSVGNPDHHEYYGSGVKSPTQTITVKSIEDARQKCLEYIRFHELGGGNWTGGQVRFAGKIVAQIRYNGKIEKCVS